MRDSNPVRVCYGSPCNDDPNFNTAGAIKDGYAVRDQAGTVTVYNYRSFGSPGTGEVVEIRQQIKPSSFNIKEDSVLITTINRNKIGFITSVNQKSNLNATGMTRTYTPYSLGNSTTMLTKSETHPEFGTRTVQSVDANGNPTKVLGYDGKVTTYRYDTDNLLTRIILPDTADDVLYEYYKNGLLKVSAQGTTRWNYTYNANNQLKSEVLTVPGKSFGLSYTYDEYLNVSEVTYPSGKKVPYTHNGFGETVSVDGYISGARYHINGSVKQYDMQNGQLFTSRINSRLQPKKWKVVNDGLSVFDMTYSYTDRGNVERIDNYFGTGTSLDNMQYDGLSRLVRADGTWGTAQYSYDIFGNIDKSHVGGVNLGYGYNYSTTGRLVTISSSNVTAVGNYLFTYDGNGNVNSNSRRWFEYDHLNRLTEAKVNAQETQTNTYDGNNMRTKMVVKKDGRNTSTWFVYNQAGSLMHELDVETGEKRDHIQFNGKTIATRSLHNRHDSDTDGMPDYFERLHGLGVFDSSDASDDDDGDGLTNLQEYQLGYLPTSRDSDQDGITDFTESGGTSVNPTNTSTQRVVIEPIFSLLLQ